MIFNKRNVITLIKNNIKYNFSTNNRIYDYINNINYFQDIKIKHNLEKSFNQTNNMNDLKEYLKYLNRLKEYDKVIEIYNNLSFKNMVDNDILQQFKYSKTKMNNQKISRSDYLDIIKQIILISITIYIIKEYLPKDYFSSLKNSTGLASPFDIANMFNPAPPKPSPNPKIKLSDIIGQDIQKAEIMQVIDYLKNPNKYIKYGALLPKGILLTGPPGSGKTQFARAIASESNVPFFYKSGSDFDEIFVGSGSKKVKDLFNAAKKYKSCVIFIDEIDAVAGNRSASDTGSDRQSINQILTEMDGFKTNNGILVIAATNLPDSLDSSITRSGRFDKKIEVGDLDWKDKSDTLKFYLSKIQFNYDFNFLDFDLWGKKMIGMNGSDIKNLVNIAAINAAKNEKDTTDLEDLDYAYDRIQMGIREKNKKGSDEELKLTAYHEIGHAYLALNNKYNNLYKVTVMPSGNALGHVL